MKNTIKLVLNYNQISTNIKGSSYYNIALISVIFPFFQKCFYPYVWITSLYNSLLLLKYCRNFQDWKNDFNDNLQNIYLPGLNRLYIIEAINKESFNYQYSLN